MSTSSEPLQKHYKYETVTSEEVIRDELDRLTHRRKRAISEELLPDAAPSVPDAVSESLTGLALSGGGIRSGALGLGILQALHRSGVLPYFDYLSTVSGGGYAGAYVTSAGSRNRNHADDSSARSGSHDDTVPYGRLKAFHDGGGLSDRMQQFIFGGHYLLRTRRFFNRHLMGLLCIWFIVVTGLSTLASISSIVFRQLDQPLAINFLAGLGLRTDISRGFFPVTCLVVLWFVCWCISFFRAAGNMARAQGRFAAKLMPITVVTFGICLAALLGNGELNLEWISSPNGIDVAGLFSSFDKFFQVALYGAIGVGLLPYLNPAALIRSGAKPKTTSDRVIFAVASRVLLYGLPFLLVSWFARENISSWTEHRFVPQEVRALGLRGESGNVTKQSRAWQHTESEELTGDNDNRTEEWNDFVALTRSEVADWSDWRSAWSPLWARLRADASKDRTSRKVPEELAKLSAEVAVLTASNARAAAALAAADEAVAAVAKNEAVAMALVAAAAGGESVIETGKDATTEGAAATAIMASAAKMANAAAAVKTTEAVRVAEVATAASVTAKAAAMAAEAAEKAAAADVEKAVENAARQKRRIAEFVWECLNRRIYETAQNAPLPELSAILSLSSDSTQRTEESWETGLFPVEQVLQIIHNESLALQSLYARTDQNTEDYAPDDADLVCYRLLALASFVPDSLQGSADRNYLGRFVVRRERLVSAKRWLTDHLSRILETTNLGAECDWSDCDRLKNADSLKGLTSEEKSRLEALEPLVEQARLFADRYRTVSTGAESESDVTPAIQKLSPAERQELAMLNRAILNAAFPETLQNPSTVFASNVLAFDQARRWSMFKWCLGLFVFAAVMVNINATTLHGFYARELANNWIQADEDSDLPLSTVDATDQCLPYHIMSGSVHWMGKRRKAAGDMQRDHFLLSPMYCGCEKTGFVATARYKDDELGLGDAIAISGAAVSPIQQGNPLLQSMLWLANLRLGQWLPNPNFGTFLPRKSRNLVASIPVTPWRLMLRIFQTAEKRPFVFVTDGGHHENLGIGPLLKRRCRFILAVDAGEDSEYAFTDLSRLMRWARVKHNVRLQPVDSLIDADDGLYSASRAARHDDHIHPMDSLRSAIDAWNELAPDNGHRLAADRLSSRHFVVLRVHYPDADGPSWLIYAKTSLTGDEPAELIRYAESDKQFPHNPTSNQFYAPDTFEAYRQLGEHIVESMIGQLPSIIAGKMSEHGGRPEAPYLGALLHQIHIARQTQVVNLSAAPPTPEAVELLRLLRRGKTERDTQDKLARRLTVHPLFVGRLLRAAMRSGTPLNPRLTSFLFPELGPEASPARQVFSQRRLPGRAKAMRSCSGVKGLNPDQTLVESLIQLAESLAVIPQELSDSQCSHHADDYDAVYQLLISIRGRTRGATHQERIDLLPPKAKSLSSTTRKKTTRRRKSDDAPPGK